FGLFRPEPCGAIDLGELLHAARPRRPFQREGIAFQLGRVEIALRGPDVDRLGPRLPEAAEGEEPALEPEPNLLLELPLGRLERILALTALALGDAPSTLVLPGPERPAGVDEKHLGAGAFPTKQQDACAAFAHHGCPLRCDGLPTASGLAY